LSGVTVIGLLTACGGASSGSSGATAAGATAGASSAAAATVTVGIVPSLSLGLLKVGEDKGLFTKQGITLKYVTVDSGPNVVTGVVAGQYDVGYTAYAPPVLAVAAGAKLKIVSGVDTTGPKGQNGGVLVRKDSGVTSFKGLAGRRIATNAPRSLLSLTIREAIAKDGGDPSGISLVPLPFAQIGKAVEDKQVDAGVILQPFQAGALAQYPNLEDLGDSTSSALPEGSPSGVLFTSTATAEAKKDVLARFRTAVDESIGVANGDLGAVKAAGAALAGLTPDQAKSLPLSSFSGTVKAGDLKPLVDLMLKFSWVKSAPDLTSFVG
jgi:ABC-type nitrate/sulfonate/bicarbonate transport system substrate-binding protein